MAIQLKKINVKFYLTDDAVLTPEDAFRIFNGWIPETTDEVLIDVADYTHVPQGPKTVLVGHEANYTLDDTDGRPGLRYGRKRDETDFVVSDGESGKAETAEEPFTAFPARPMVDRSTIRFLAGRAE